MSKETFHFFLGVVNTGIRIEILLATLLLKFEFASTGDKIAWNLSQIIFPSVQNLRTVDGEEVIEERKGLPLLVRIREDSN